MKEGGKKIIVALDVSSVDEAETLVKQLAPFGVTFKIGLEFIYTMLGRLVAPNIDDSGTDFFKIRRLFRNLDGNIFWDGKLNDIPNTVAGATASISRIGVRMLNVHCLSGIVAMKRTLEEAEKIAGKNRPLILGVTILTSLGDMDLREIGLVSGNMVIGDEQESLVRRKILDLAWLAFTAGLDGVVCSPKEIQTIRASAIPKTFKIVVPGVRPLWYKKPGEKPDDQKRIDTPAEAIKAGADYLVIGRPIIDPPKKIGGPVEAIKEVIEEIETVI